MNFFKVQYKLNIRLDPKEPGIISIDKVNYKLSDIVGTQHGGSGGGGQGFAKSLGGYSKIAIKLTPTTMRASQATSPIQNPTASQRVGGRRGLSAHAKQTCLEFHLVPPSGRRVVWRRCRLGAGALVCLAPDGIGL